MLTMLASIFAACSVGEKEVDKDLELVASGKANWMKMLITYFCFMEIFIEGGLIFSALSKLSKKKK